MTDVPGFATGVAFSILPAYLDVIKLSTILQTMPGGLMVSAPHSWLAVVPYRYLDFLGHVDEWIFERGFSLVGSMRIFVFQRLHCR